MLFARGTLSIFALVDLFLAWMTLTLYRAGVIEFAVGTLLICGSITGFVCASLLAKWSSACCFTVHAAICLVLMGYWLYFRDMDREAQSILFRLTISVPLCIVLLSAWIWMSIARSARPNRTHPT